MPTPLGLGAGKDSKHFMEEEKSVDAIATSLKNTELNSDETSKYPLLFSSRNPFRLRVEKAKSLPPSLMSLCLGVVGSHLEDILDELSEIAIGLPNEIKMAIAAIARRRKLLTDDVIISLADSSWKILDLSGSDVSDSGLAKVAQVCKSLQAVDLSCCGKITESGVSELVWHCHLLEIVRLGGCPRSESTARRCLSILIPKLNEVEEDSWEVLDSMEIGHGAQSLRWLVWPKIDKDSLERLSAECPRIIVNPKPSLFGFRGTQVPHEALPDIVLDDPLVKDIDPKTWIVIGVTPKPMPCPLSDLTELSMAEKFRLAFVERDTRLAPKRAKNARQHQRRAEREWMMTSTRAKALALASQASKSLHGRS